LSADLITRLKNAKGKELYEVILEAELESEKEYLRLSEKVTDKQVSKMFKKVAKEERKHHDKIAKQFLDVLYQMDDSMRPEAIDLPEFKEAPNSKKVSANIEYKEALKLALEGEKLAYKIYSAASEKTDHKPTKKMLRLIADEEKNHYQFLFNEFNK
jgi:rubrerythrin